MTFNPEEISFKEFRIEDYNAVMELWELAGLPVKKNGRDHPDNMKEELKRGIAHFILVEPLKAYWYCLSHP